VRDALSKDQGGAIGAFLDSPSANVLQARPPPPTPSHSSVPRDAGMRRMERHARDNSPSRPQPAICTHPARFDGGATCRNLSEKEVAFHGLVAPRGKLEYRPLGEQQRGGH
jgi:hypothetical protein